MNYKEKQNNFNKRLKVNNKNFPYISSNYRHKVRKIKKYATNSSNRTNYNNF